MFNGCMFLGSVVKSFKESRSAITSYFFGDDGTQKLTVKKFIEFQQRLQVSFTIWYLFMFTGVLACIHMCVSALKTLTLNHLQHQLNSTIHYSLEIAEMYLSWYRNWLSIIYISGKMSYTHKMVIFPILGWYFKIGIQQTWS